MTDTPDNEQNHQNGQAEQNGQSGQAGRDRQDRQRTQAGIADEAMRLFDSLQRRIGTEFGKGMGQGLGKGFVKGGVSGLNQAFGGGRAPSADVWSEAVSDHHDDEEYICRACPVCRAKAAARESGGDVTDHLVAAGGELLAAFRQAFDVVTRPQRATPRDRDRVEHIDLG
jgi:hypothetical protein